MSIGSETPKKVEKHIAFDEAIEGLHRDINNLGSFVDRIRGTDKQLKETTDEAKAPRIALGDFIANGAERIENIRAQLNEYKNTLGELLF